MNKSRRRSLDQWREIICALPESGMSIAAYCRSRGISQPSFSIWRRRLAGAVAEARVSVASFVEIKAPAAEAKAAGGIEVRLGGGRWLRVRRGFDRVLLKELIQALEGTPAGLGGVA